AYSLLPSDLPDVDATVSLHLYLYHVLEDPYQKNQPPVLGGEQDVRFNSMGLQLYYQLTVTAKGLNENIVPKAQQAFGLALKALHDHPRLDAQTLASYSDIGRPDLRTTPD